MGGVGRSGHSRTLLEEMQNGVGPTEGNLSIPRKLHLYFPFGQTVLFLGILSQGRNKKRHMHEAICCSSVSNSKGGDNPGVGQV